MAGRVRGFETVGDMLRSLGVVGIFVVVILAITLRQTPDKIQVVDASPIEAAVEQAAPFPAQVPGPVPAGWKATSARVSLPTDRPYTWYVGYSTDTGEFVAITQIYGALGRYLAEVGAKGQPDGSVTIAGQTWTKSAQSDGSRRSVVRTNGDVTTVVTGTAPYSVLERTAAALRAVR